jgi:hypothetical protein
MKKTLNDIRVGDSVRFIINGELSFYSNKVTKVSDSHIDVLVNDPCSMIHCVTFRFPKTTNEIIRIAYGKAVYKIAL